VTNKPTHIGRSAAAVALAALAGCFAAAPTSMAAANTHTLFTPAAFQLQGSNGYSIFVSGQPTLGKHPDTVDVSVSRGRVSAFYSAPATVTETSIQANLGELGEIDVTFHGTGQTRTIRPKCGRPVPFETGYFEGQIAFHGEEGFTEAQATSAKAAVEFFSVCIGSGGGSFNRFSRGAELYTRNPGLGPRLGVVKQDPSAPARFGVSVSEYRNGISIDRYATLRMPPGAFRYSPHLQTATLRPGAPFSGSANFNRRRNGSRRWQGNLTVDMPGRAGVPLTGPTIRAYLVRPMILRK
jgi:hypothetical protein